MLYQADAKLAHYPLHHHVPKDTKVQHGEGGVVKVV